MFWRLFLTYLALILSVSALVGLLLFQGTDPRDLSPGTASRFLFTALLIALLAIGVAYLLARWVASPLDALGDGAQRLADGELGTSIPVKGPEASRRLARAFNAMSDRLAETFQESERDRERYRAILAGMAEGVVAIDRDQTIQFANRRAGELLEFDPAQAAGRKLWEVSRRPSIQDAVERAFAEPVAQRAELTWPGPKPRILTLSVARLPGDPPQGVVVVIDDATELRQLEQLRRDFVANVSHELKTPLAIIKSGVEVLLDGAAEDPDSRDSFLKQIDDQAERLTMLIHDVLQLARIESGGHQLNSEPVPLIPIVTECLDRHRARAASRGLTLVQEPTDLNPVIQGDDDALDHILDNLVDNAIKYTPKGGTITLRFDRENDDEIIEIRDTGDGINERDLPRIFERFYRVDKARSRNIPGTGLGLAIVKHLTSAMKGTIRVKSRVGHGTTFRIALPRSRDG